MTKGGLPEHKWNTKRRGMGLEFVALFIQCGAVRASTHAACPQWRVEHLSSASPPRSAPFQKVSPSQLEEQHGPVVVIGFEALSVEPFLLLRYQSFSIDGCEEK